MKRGSLRLRLLAGGATAILIALLVAGVGLTYLFERHVMRSLADELEVDLRQMMASIELDAAGHPQLRREPADPRFSDPLSGLYWQLSAEPGGFTRSRSLWDAKLPLPSDVLAPGDVHQHRLTGPGGSELLAIERTVLLKAADAPIPVRLVVAADIARITAARRSFTFDLVPSLLLLGLVLGSATWIQIGLGLRPLARVREGVAAVRSGVSRALEGELPSEVAPLVEEINGLLAAKERDVERARGRAADLAHGLKTPLSALAADVRTLHEQGDHAIADRIAEVGESMRRHVERELARARIRGAVGPATRTPLRPLAETLVSIQKRSEAGARLKFDLEFDRVGEIAMDKADLAEVLGNLLENAAHHARSQIRLTSLEDGRIAVEDDGPGIPEEVRTLALKRGARLDEKPGGSGLGLAIVQEVLDAYGRRLTLESSSLGGLRAVF